VSQVRLLLKVSLGHFKYLLASAGTAKRRIQWAGLRPPHQENNRTGDGAENVRASRMRVAEESDVARLEVITTTVGAATTS
jgi:hypothetical protein